jgi:hypothetical protein
VAAARDHLTSLASAWGQVHDTTRPRVCAIYSASLCLHCLIKRTFGCARADPGKQLQDAKSCYSITHILRPTQDGDDILDVSGFQMEYFCE